MKIFLSTLIALIFALAVQFHSQMTSSLPTLFMSHGAPTMVLGKDPKETVEFMRGLGKKLSAMPLRAILCISAHWETSGALRVSASKQPEQIYDFYGFPKETYEVKYPLKGSPEVAKKVVDQLVSSGIEAELDMERGIDHGFWALLCNMFPTGEVPVVQLSLNANLDYAFHVRVGNALRSLRNSGILVISSGGAVHNLGDLDFNNETGSHYSWADQFDLLLSDALTSNDPVNALLSLPKSNGQLLKKAHPRTEHLMPVYVMAGTLNSGEKVKQLHKHMQFRSLSLASYGTL